MSGDPIREAPTQTRYVVEHMRPGQYGYVVVDRRSDSVVTHPMTRTEAQWEVWERNGRHGAPPRGKDGAR